MIFAHDPAVQTTCAVLRQALDQGRDVLLLPHSGGGTESALALNLLAGDYRDQIQDHVKVVSLAGGDAGTVRRNLVEAVRSFAGDPNAFKAHQPDTILRDNQAEMAAFLSGGPGGVHLAAPPAP